MLQNLKIGTKLIGGFIAVALIAVAIGITGIVCQRSLDAANVEMYEKSTVPAGHLIDMTSSLQRLRVALRDILLNPQKQAYAAKIEGLKQDLTRQSAEFEKGIVKAETRRHFEDFTDARKKYEVYLDQIVSLAQAGKEKEATQVLYQGDALKAAEAMQEAFNHLRDDKLASATRRMQESSALASRSSGIMIAAIVAGLVLAVVLGLVLTHSITTPVARVVKALEALAGGDLTQKLESTSQDEIGQMERNLDSVCASLVRAIAEIRGIAC